MVQYGVHATVQFLNVPQLVAYAADDDDGLYWPDCVQPYTKTKQTRDIRMTAACEKHDPPIDFVARVATIEEIFVKIYAYT